MFKSKSLKLSFSVISLGISLVLLAGCGDAKTEPKTGAAAIFHPDLFTGTELKQFMKLPQF
ncbi:MAG: hypothetical protein PHZ11_07040 [Desulfitobacteriaceae bacterium]|nr:hypothetical protein [Clostridia bacterium]MDD4346627.1 hypothetical protein [Desulfitobacteriaceae bacterium]